MRWSAALVLVLLLTAPAVAPAAPAVGVGAAVERSRQVTLPTVGTDVDYQLGGVRPVPRRVGIVVRDREADPRAGRYNVCYVNGFQTQASERRFWKKRPRLVLRDADGDPVVDEAWGERLLDLRTADKRKRLARIVGRWTHGCAADGFDAVEFDNLDSFTRSDGLLTRRHAVRYARLLVRRAHREGLAAAQKNLAGWDGRRAGFDFAVAEECGRYRECASYTRHYGRRVLSIEYRRSDFRWTCRRFGDRLAVVLRDRDLSADGLRRWC
ncbi:endo alpha-1,4 polygalactosaminidase [Nocardioides ferulae]|uniref:endo alpha-1,4 polygalactosaminidase n=1 Tax=Nocardioides ferulae TaxID=2340821 RepID=UPI000EB3025C|nr:endo alpha-1,4 polygalactosaminidase [Nocardioides ferulae]